MDRPDATTPPSSRARAARPKSTPGPDEAVHPFTFRAPQAELDDLRARLLSARLPERETVAGAATEAERRSQGVPLEEMRELIQHWIHGHDWRRLERRLDEIGQITTVIDGVEIHALHRRSPRPDAVPLLLTHGWPGSIVEFIGIIDALSDPEDPRAPAFHIVAPSLPGYGFSGRPCAPGWGIERIAATWVELMERLGYGRFLAQGGDWGGPITTILGGRFPERVIGIHMNWAEGPPGMSWEGLSDEERGWAENTRDFTAHRLAYAKIQQSSPQTLGYSLVDSPVGLLAFIAEKFAEWSDDGPTAWGTIPREALLDDVTLYWLTRTGASAARIYAESHQALDPELRVSVPTAICTYPADIAKCPRPWAERRYERIVHWAAAESGGHFAALEVPEAFTADVRAGLAAVLRAADERS